MALGASGQAGSELEKAAMVIGRSLAFLCLQSAPVMKEGTVLQKAQFLSGLGLEFDDAARMLGSTTASLNELARLERKGKGAKRGKKGKTKRRKR
jgi:hypothetical protein